MVVPKRYPARWAGIRLAARQCGIGANGARLVSPGSSLRDPG